jgi:hypothetical protein
MKNESRILVGLCRLGRGDPSEDGENLLESLVLLGPFMRCILPFAEAVENALGRTVEVVGGFATSGKSPDGVGRGMNSIVMVVADWEAERLAREPRVAVPFSFSAFPVYSGAAYQFELSRKVA